jgi:hypothetical protein
MPLFAGRERLAPSTRLSMSVGGRLPSGRFSDFKYALAFSPCNLLTTRSLIGRSMPERYSNLTGHVYWLPATIRAADLLIPTLSLTF